MLCKNILPTCRYYLVHQNVGNCTILQEILDVISPHAKKISILQNMRWEPCFDESLWISHSLMTDGMLAPLPHEYITVKIISLTRTMRWWRRGDRLSLSWTVQINHNHYNANMLPPSGNISSISSVSLTLTYLLLFLQYFSQIYYLHTCTKILLRTCTYECSSEQLKGARISVLCGSCRLYAT